MKKLIFLLTLPVAAPAAAQVPQPGEVRVAGEALVLSDYRFRGVSRSDEDPAVQGALTVQKNGWYAGGRGTSLEDAGRLRAAQLDLFAGYGANLDLATSIDAGLLYYVFPDGSGATDYFEPYASVSRQLGPVLGTLGAKYAWSQAAIGGEDMLYLFGEVEAAIPAMPLTAVAGIGRQSSDVLGSYWNWQVGAEYARGSFFAGLRYVDTDLPPLPNQDAGLVLSAGVRF